MGVLEGLLVVEMASGIAGSAAGMFFADQGARVLKIERPEGSAQRSAASFQVLNRSKESVVVDPADDHDRRLLQALLERAEVCIAADAGLWREFGLEEESIRAQNPGQVLVTMPPYVDDADGEPEDAEALSAMLGMAVNQCSHDGGPIEIIEPQLLYVQGALAALAGAAGLYEAITTGRGRTMTVSGAHAFVAFAPQLLVFDPTHPIRERDLGPGGAHPLYSTYMGSDGRWVFMGALSDKFMRRALEVIDDLALLEDPRIEGDTDRLYNPGNRRWVRRRLAERFRTRESGEWLRLLEAADIPAAPVQVSDEWLDHPQFAASCGHAVVQHPELGEIRMPRQFFKLTGVDAAAPRPAPQLGENRGDLGSVHPSWPRLPTQDSDRQPPWADGPLAGLRVASLGSYVAGPQTARLLHLMGADVIKVEPTSGDPWRRYGFQFSEGIRSLAIDLRSAQGLRAFERMAETLDVVIDNLRPGYLTKIGADHECLRAIKPDVITTSLTGFGESGPLAYRPGFDPVLGALSGMQSAQGGDAEPVVMSLAVNDTGGAVLAALATTFAVLHKKRTGQGQHVECSLASASTYLQTDSLVRYRGRPPARRGGRDHRGSSPWRRYYQAADGWVRLDAPASCADLAAKRLDVPEPPDRDDPVDVIAERVARLPIAEIEGLFAETGVRVIRVRNARDAVHDAPYRTLPVAHLVHPEGVARPFYTAGHVAGVSGQRPRVPAAVPGVGEQTDEILTEAGLSAEEIDQIVAAGHARRGTPYVPEVLEPYR